MLDSGYNLGRIAVKWRKPNRWFKRGTLYRRALDVPMTAAEIGAAVLAAHGVEDATKEDAQTVALGIQHSLKNHEGKGVERVGEVSPARWRVLSTDC